MISPDNNNRSLLRSNKIFWLIIAIGLIVRVVFSLITQYISDDAFITYRYAQNILSGNGYVYNMGEKVLGTTSPLYTILLAFFGFLFGSINIPVVSTVLSIAADLGSLYCLWYLIPDEFSVSRFVVVALYSLYPKVILIGVSGMEASLSVFLMLLSLLSYSKKMYFLTAVLISLSFVCRPDNIIWIALLTGIILFYEKKINIKYFLISITLPVIWVYFSIHYFGSVIPYSISAKIISWTHLFPVFDPLRVISGYLPALFIQGRSQMFVLLIVILCAIPFIIGFWNLWSIKSVLYLFPLFFIIYNFVFAFGRVLMADWYYLPGYMAYFITIGFCLQDLKERLSPNNFTPIIRTLCMTSIIAILLVLNLIGMNRWNKNLSGLFQGQNEAMGKWLARYSSPVKSVLVEPIGYIGYFSKMYVYDYIGLVSPEILRYRKMYNSDRWYINFLREKEPDFIVFRNWELPSNRLFHGYGGGIFKSQEERAWFDTYYELVDWNNNPANDSVYLVLYGLRSINFAGIR